MRIALRTALATAAVAGVALTPVLTAGAAYAADAPTAGAPTAGASAAAEPKPHEIPLPNALVAQIRQIEPGVFTAQILQGDTTLGTLRAGTAPGNPAVDKKVFAGVEVTLTAQGKISAVVVDDGTGQDDELGELFARKDLGHDYKGLVYKKGGVLTAKIFKGEKQVGTLRTDRTQTRDEADFGGEMRVTLHWDGSLRATWLGDTDPSSPKPAPKAGTPLTQPKVTGCAVRQQFASVFPHWTLTLVNDKAKGPRAVLIDDKGTVAGTADRQHPVNGHVGLKIVDAGTYTPKFGQRSEGGDAPYAYVAFPKLPESCTERTAPAPGAQGGQTTVVPKGGVAAGAEFASQDGPSTQLLAAGAGAAAIAAAGLGFVVLRRRAEARV
ncbi:hypothetical protein [Streptomyces tritici]|uniref:hypothetical protein n=1 Tax=Streptomyces tritici TaxID=2054410 RepID=UPI003AF17FF2